MSKTLNQGGVKLFTSFRLYLPIMSLLNNMFSQLKYYPNPMREYNDDEMIELLCQSPRSICIQRHPDSIIRETNSYAVTVNISFPHTIYPLYYNEVGDILSPNRHDSYNDDSYWKGYEESTSVAATKALSFKDKYYKTVFIRDSLSLSLSLGLRAIGDDGGELELTDLGRLFHNAKYNECADSINQVSSQLNSFLSSAPYYADVDYIVPIPSTKVDNPNNLPLILAEQTKKEIVHVEWNKKLTLKGRSIDEKLQFLKELEVDLEGKHLPETIILLDDLYESGITMNLFAQKLFEHGVKNIYGLTIVKAVHN